jgi:NTP pyrophosphatase (non-canonical NTP hydrolase)
VDEVIYINEYQKGTLETWSGDAKRQRSILGISGEAGEVAECFKKYLRGDYDYEAYRVKLKKELGDVLYYIAACAYEHDFMLSEIADANYEKLKKRKALNMINGSGDDREDEDIA